jgi:tripartite-type tricarboxylate transporter receptor subunit TctC
MVIDKMSSAEYQKFVNSEFDRWGAYIRTAGISLDQ